MRKSQRRRMVQRCQVSKRFRHAMRTAGKPQYTFARDIVDRSTLSAWMNDIIPVRAGDPRVIAIGRLLGLSPDDCFEPAPTPRRGGLRGQQQRARSSDDGTTTP